MSSAPRHPITLQPVRYVVQDTETVTVRHDIPYGSAGEQVLTLDLYQSEARDPAPVVVLVTGYQDVGVPRRLGCAFKEMAMWSSLGRILAASGIALVGYTSAQPAQDLDSVLQYVDEHAPDLNVDARRVGLWATSGHVPTAIGALARHGGRTIRTAVLSAGYTLDLEGSSVEEASRRYGFANPQLTFADLPSDVPVFLARAGRDEHPGLNDALDRFVAAALMGNWPLMLLNHAAGGHAFELTDDGPIASFAVQQMIAFTRFWLGCGRPGASKLVHPSL